ncbi:MAG: histidine kinase [Saprospiraceae bacterium]|nr:histidine kinase [Saprospiraceae bacterium]
MSEGKYDELGFYLPKNFAMVNIQMLVVYSNWWFLFPYLFQRKQYAWYIATAIILIYASFVLSFLWIDLTLKLVNSVLYGSTFLAPPPVFFYKFWTFFSGSVPYSLALLCSLVVLIYQEKKQHESLAKELKIENAKSEIRYLRAQINPHLLFNSLNNLHTLILTRPEVAADYTLHLSDLLRYMLYEAKKNTTPLRVELEGLMNYLALIEQKMSHADQKKVVIDVQNPTLGILPLILISLVENGVKHSGIEYDPSSWLELRIQEKNQQLQLLMKNSIRLQRKEEDRAGIGLENVKKRLALNYPDRHDFSFKLDKNTAITQVTIQLAI